MAVSLEECLEVVWRLLAIHDVRLVKIDQIEPLQLFDFWFHLF